LVRHGFRPISFSKYVAGIELTTDGMRQRDPRLLEQCFGDPCTAVLCCPESGPAVTAEDDVLG
jgi:hypothetical protein